MLCDKRLVRPSKELVLDKTRLKDLEVEPWL